MKFYIKHNSIHKSKLTHVLHTMKAGPFYYLLFLVGYLGFNFLLALQEYFIDEKITGVSFWGHVIHLVANGASVYLLGTLAITILLMLITAWRGFLIFHTSVMIDESGIRFNREKIGIVSAKSYKVSFSKISKIIKMSQTQLAIYEIKTILGNKPLHSVWYVNSSQEEIEDIESYVLSKI